MNPVQLYISSQVCSTIFSDSGTTSHSLWGKTTPLFLFFPLTKTQENPPCTLHIKLFLSATNTSIYIYYI